MSDSHAALPVDGDFSASSSARTWSRVGAQHRHFQAFADIADRSTRPASAGTRNGLPSALTLLTSPPGRSTCGSVSRSSGRLIGEKQMFSCIQPGRQLGDVPAPDLLGNARNDPRTRQNAIGGIAQGRVVGKFLQAEFTAEAVPMAFGDHADEDALAAGGVENVVDRPGVLALRHRARLVRPVISYSTMCWATRNRQFSNRPMRMSAPLLLPPRF